MTKLLVITTIGLSLAVLIALFLLLYGILQQEAVSNDVATLQQTFAGVIAYLANVMRGYLDGGIQQMRVVAQFMASRSGIHRLDVDGAQFERFAQSATPQAASVVVAWAPLVPRANVSDFVADVRRANANVTSWNASSFDVTSTPSQFNGDAVFPLLFTYPPSPLPRGFDLASDSIAGDAIERARATRTTTVTVMPNSPTIVLYQPAFSYDDTGADGLPLFVGVTFISVNVKAVVELTLLIATMNYTTGNVDAFQVRWLSVTDRATNASLSLYALHDERFANNTVNPLLASNTTIEIGQHLFLLEQGFLGELPPPVNPAIVVMGAIVAVGVIAGCIMLVCYRVRLDREKRRRQLLAMVVPEHVVAKLIPHLQMVDGDATLDNTALVADNYHNVTLCFIDICDFTAISSTLPPTTLVRFLDEMVSLVDSIVAKHPRVLKIKTIGDAYFVAAGVHEAHSPLLLRRQSVGSAAAAALATKATGLSPEEKEARDIRARELRAVPDHVRNLVSTLQFCCDVQRTLQAHHFRFDETNSDGSPVPSPQRRSSAMEATAEDLRVSEVLAKSFDTARHELRVSVRVGVHMGDVVAGVVGTRRPQYDVWGDACNVAARIESSALAGTIQVSHVVFNTLIENGLEHFFEMQKRGDKLVLKGLGAVDAYSLSPKVVEWQDALP